MLVMSSIIEFELEEQNTQRIAKQAGKQPKAKIKAEKAEAVRTATAKSRRLPLRMAKAATVPWTSLSFRIDIRRTHPRLTILEGGMGKEGGVGRIKDGKQYRMEGMGYLIVGWNKRELHQGPIYSMWRTSSVAVLAQLHVYVVSYTCLTLPVPRCTALWRRQVWS